ncbi:hypothetical protein Tco_0340650 [Tanacetum coccineum]
MVTKTDISVLARETKEEVMPIKPSVMLKYPDSIHFSTTCMIKGTDHANWDDIWYISNQTDKHLCYKLDFFCNIKEGVYYSPEVTLNILSIDLLVKQGFEIKYDSNRCSLVYIFNNKEGQKLNEDRMRTMQNQYLENYFESVARKDEGMEEDLIRIKGNLYSAKMQTFNEYVAFLNLIKHDEIVNQEWDIFRSRFNKVVRWFYNHSLERSLPGPIPPAINGVQIHLAPQQGYNTILEESKRKVEDKDRDCLMSHQWDFGETCEPTARTAVQKGKEKLEHLGVKLEDTEEGEDSQEQPTLSHSTRIQNLQRMIIGPSTLRITSNGESGSNTSDDFIILT